LTTVQARAFWMCWRRFIWYFGRTCYRFADMFIVCAHCVVQNMSNSCRICGLDMRIYRRPSFMPKSRTLQIALLTSGKCSISCFS